jgi:hypothetical protein
MSGKRVVFFADPMSPLARSQRGSWVREHAGCQAGLEGCQSIADRIACEDEQPTEATPTWRLVAVCPACAARLQK